MVSARTFVPSADKIGLARHVVKDAIHLRRVFSRYLWAREVHLGADQEER
jgi:hypothetical protein